MATDGAPALSGSSRHLAVARRPARPDRPVRVSHLDDSLARSETQLSASKTKRESSAARPEARWMLLIHQIPPTPAYLRVKIGRHLARIGAVAIKNSVYALPYDDETQEDFQWVLREVVKGGGDASIVEARFIEGLSDMQVIELFQTEREADFRHLAGQARAVAAAFPHRGVVPDDRRADLARQVARLRQRATELATIDFFGAPGREVVDGLLSGMEARMRPVEGTEPAKASLAREQYQGRTWVTRTGIKVDRMASAWLIRKFIDPEARFKFVPAKGYRPEEGELRFDMFESEFTHEGELCTFEVLVQRFGLTDPALRAIAEIVHDIDVKDAKYGREEAPGIGQLVAGIAAAHADDEQRLARGAALFDDLYAVHGATRH
ncbi:chromate resistance protein ChrB domain-containing protein [Anaeromyxobacter terrae]|uniref:chromate resistance protein ChrB domain-containing protein n=1 Tax=Anaeromyxobacter terrae TaxID=2925406 RepID=UPI001F5A96A0|nr:chromate resistance protein ChrB domain-containing protein [Anaeromyxobacter sp. SG22]